MAWYADLHCQPCFSGECLNTAQVVALASEKGVRMLAVTDHDSIGGWTSAGEEARGLSVTVIPGVEINTNCAGEEIHVLGYFDPRFIERDVRADGVGQAVARRVARRRAELDEMLAALRHKRVERARAIVQKLRGLGVDIVWSQVEGIVSGPSVGRAHIARVLVELGAAASVEEAFGRYLSVGAAAYVPNDYVHPLEAISVIAQCGGVPVLAHPKDRGAEVWQGWLGTGLAGLEVWHPDHSMCQTERLVREARRFGLLTTGGSDFHGFGLHGDLGSCGIDETRAEQLLFRLAERYEKIEAS